MSPDQLYRRLANLRHEANAGYDVLIDHLCRFLVKNNLAKPALEFVKRRTLDSVVDFEKRRYHIYAGGNAEGDPIVENRSLGWFKEHESFGGGDVSPIASLEAIGDTVTFWEGGNQHSVAESAREITIKRIK